MTRPRRVALWVAAILAALLAATGALAFAFFHTFYPSPPAPPGPVSEVTGAQRQDLEYFRNYFDLNRSYTPAALKRTQQLFADAESKAGSFSSAEFDLAVARIVALADNGHSRVNPGPLSRHHNRLPCRLYHFDDGFHVIRARPACSQLLGAKVVAVDSRPINEVADHMFEYFGGPRNHYDQFASVFFLESPELLNAAGLAVVPDRLKLRFLLPDGSEQEIELKADPPDAEALRAYSDEFLSPNRIEKEPADWATFLAADSELPVFLREYTNPFRAEYWKERGVYYAQFRSNEDEEGHPIGPFVERIKTEIASERPRTIVLDLRFDQGGNFITTARLMSNLTQLSDSIEHVYALTSAWTFSAGNVSLALLKEHGGAKVTVLGAPVGDRIRIWAEGGALVLPNSKLSIGFATGMHDYERGCWGEAGCFWVMFFYPTHIATFEPDVRVPYSFDDYQNLRDPVLQRALELASTAPLTPGIHP